MRQMILSKHTYECTYELPRTETQPKIVIHSIEKIPPRMNLMNVYNDVQTERNVCEINLWICNIICVD